MLSPPVHAGTLPVGFEQTAVVSGLTNPLSLAFLPDGGGRFIVVEQGGVIKAIDGGVAATLHTMTTVNQAGAERGLLGVAVDPDWPTRPYLYVHYTAVGPPASVQVARFTLTEVGNALQVDSASRLVLLDDMPDAASNHNGGTLRFGPDKTLYISVGDDATPCNAQDLTILAGKILRIRVDDTIDPANRATLAPAGNPFASNPSDNAKLVWAYGLRNPFRFGIDPATGQVFIGDVGQDTWEEVSLAAPSGGQNFGWPYFEGEAPYQGTPCPGAGSIPATTPPVYVYSNPALGLASVIGATVYRPPSPPVGGSLPSAFDGTFFLMDFYAGWLRVLKESDPPGAWSLVAGVSPTDFGMDFAYVADLIESSDGALYAVGGDSVTRITYEPPGGGGPWSPGLTSTKGSLTGVVVDERGSLAGAAVVVYDDAGREAARTATDGSGWFRVDGLFEGAYRVVVEAAGRKTREVSAVVVPGATTDLGTLEVTSPSSSDVHLAFLGLFGIVAVLLLWLRRRAKASPTRPADREDSSISKREGDEVASRPPAAKGL